MLTTIRFPNGLRFDSLLLAADSERMRVAIASQRDTVELRKVDACWYTETGVAIEIEALIPLQGTEFSCFCNALHPGIQATGRALMVA
jgi:hypothetical protein